MHLVVKRIVLRDGPEGIEPHLQMHACDVNASGFQLVQKPDREVQACRRCCRASLLGRVNGLVELVITGIFLDVGRQRRMAHQMNGPVNAHGPRRRKAHRTRAIRFVDSHDLALEHDLTVMLELHARTCLEALAGLY